MTCTNGLFWALSLAVAVVGCTRAAGDSAVRRTGGAADEPFIAASGAAMEQMMKAMAIRPSGDVDRDFVAMMIPHHGSAIAVGKSSRLNARHLVVGCVALWFGQYIPSGVVRNSTDGSSRIYVESGS